MSGEWNETEDTGVDSIGSLIDDDNDSTAGNNNNNNNNINKNVTPISRRQAKIWELENVALKRITSNFSSQMQKAEMNIQTLTTTNRALSQEMDTAKNMLAAALTAYQQEQQQRASSSSLEDGRTSSPTEEGLMQLLQRHQTKSLAELVSEWTEAVKNGIIGRERQQDETQQRFQRLEARIRDLENENNALRHEESDASTESTQPTSRFDAKSWRGPKWMKHRASSPSNSVQEAAGNAKSSTSTTASNKRPSSSCKGPVLPTKKTKKSQAASKSSAKGKASGDQDESSKGKKKKHFGQSSTVPLRGVTQRPSGKWQAQLWFAGKSRYIGVFDTLEKANMAHEIARERLRGSSKVPNESKEEAITAAFKAAHESINGTCPEFLSGTRKPQQAD